MRRLHANQWRKLDNAQSALAFASTKPGQERAKGRPVTVRRAKPAIRVLPADDPLTYQMGEASRFDRR